MNPVEHTTEELPLGSPWSSEDPNQKTYVSVARPKFAALVDEARERLASHGIVVEGPLLPADEDAAKKSRHDTWVLRIPEGAEAEAEYATDRMGRLVGPIRTEILDTLQTNGHVVDNDALPGPICRRMGVSPALVTEPV